MIAHFARFALVLSLLLLPNNTNAVEPDEVFASDPVESQSGVISAEAEEEPSSPQVAQAPADPVEQVSWWQQAGLTTPSSVAASGAPPPFPSVRLTGFFQADAAWFAQDRQNQQVVGDIEDIVDFRRARLAAAGQAYENVGYMVEFDFGFPGRPSFMDVYLELQDLPVGTLRAGHWRQPFGMDAMTSVKELWFLERALPFAFVPFRQTGLGAFNTALEERVTWAVSGYKFPVGPFGGNVGDAGYGMATRVTFNPLYDETMHDVVHVGVNYSFNSPSTKRIRYATTPEIGFTLGDFNGMALAVPFFVNTGPIVADGANLLGAELAAALGSLTIQSEVMYALVNQQGGPSLAFPGAYVQAAYALTGEHHPYNRKSGVFTRLIPEENFGTHAGAGAWELAARWSYIDLDDENVLGGHLQDLTCGLNWTLNPHTRVQFNYIRAFLDRIASGRSDANVFAVRAQVDF